MLIAAGWLDALPSEVLIRFVDPIGTRRCEYIDIDRVLQRNGSMRNIWRYAKELSRSHRDFLAIDREVERALLDMRELLVEMAMQRHHATFFEENARDHDLITHNELTIE